MGRPLDLHNPPDLVPPPLGTPDINTSAGTGEGQALSARQSLAQEYAGKPSDALKANPAAGTNPTIEVRALAQASTAEEVDPKDQLLAPHKTWEQKYEAVEKYIRDNYYPKERLESSNFYQLDKKYFGHIKSEADYVKALKAETQTLDDPWTQFTSKAEINSMRKGSEEGHRSTGVWVKQQGKDTVIEALLYGFPAYKSDLRIGDKITAINGKSVAGLKLDQIEPLLQGKKGQTIKVDFQTPEGETKVQELPLVDPVEMHSSAHIIEDPQSGKKILHLGLLSFDKDADDQLEDAIKAIPKEQLDAVSGIVLDLRGNEGGYLPPILRTADMFVPPGDLFRLDSRDGSHILKTTGFDESDYTLDAGTRAMLRTVPMSILINGTTRSAPETLTASLRERGRPCAVVGDKSYGKAIAYDDVPVPDGMLKLTIEELKTPKGVVWHGKGIQPDIQVANQRGANADDVQLARAIEAVVAGK